MGIDMMHAGTIPTMTAPREHGVLVRGPLLVFVCGEPRDLEGLHAQAVPRTTYLSETNQPILQGKNSPGRAGAVRISIHDGAARVLGPRALQVPSLEYPQRIGG